MALMGLRNFIKEKRGRIAEEEINSKNRFQSGDISTVTEATSPRPL